MHHNKNKRLAFYVDYDRFNSKEAPPILFFISFLRNTGYKVDFFIKEKDLINAFKNHTAIIAEKKPFNAVDAVSGTYYDACLLSLMSADNLRKILQTAIKIKEASPFTVNILGGTGVYGYYKDLIKAEGIDITIEGDAEKTLPAVLDNITTIYKYYDNEKHKDFIIEEPNGKIFKNYPNKLMSGITKEEAYFCTSDHMEILFKRKGQYLSPIMNVPEMIFFKRRIKTYQQKLPSLKNEEESLHNISDMIGQNKEQSVKSENSPTDFVIKCPVSNIAIKLNNEAIRFFEKVDLSHNDFNRFYEPYKDIITSEEFASVILPFPSEEEINAEYIDYPWDIYDHYKFESIGIYAQRGCNWGKCSYCSIVNYKYRKLDTGFLIKILNEAKNHYVSGISFDDDLFVQNKKWTNEFFDGIIAVKLNKRFNFTAMFKVEHIDNIELLNKIKKANFSKIQLGVESFLPKKISYFSKTKEGKELIYINKAKKVIDYCANIGIIPSSFIILTIPDKDFSLFDIVQEMGEIVDIIINVYDRHKVLPIFMFNDFINAYPNAPLLNKQAYSKFIVPLCGEVDSSEHDGVLTNILNLRSIGVPYLYKFENLKIAHFINILLKLLKDSEDKGLNVGAGEEERMFIHIKNILNSLNSSFDLYGSPTFLLYDIIDYLDLTYNENTGILKDILAHHFGVNDINKFKNYIASGKIDAHKALSIFSGIISGFDELNRRQKEEKDKGKAITDILIKRVESFLERY